jgi:hypothetical protein
MANASCCSGGEAVLGRGLRERAHQPARHSVFQAVEEHVVQHPAMTHAQAGALAAGTARWSWIHAAGDDDFALGQQQQIMSKHRCLHARATSC